MRRHTREVSEVKYVITDEVAPIGIIDHDRLVIGAMQSGARWNGWGSG